MSEQDPINKRPGIDDRGQEIQTNAFQEAKDLGEPEGNPSEHSIPAPLIPEPEAWTYSNLDEQIGVVRSWVKIKDPSVRHLLLPGILHYYGDEEMIAEMESQTGIEDKAFQLLLSVWPEMGEAVLVLAILRKYTDYETNFTPYGSHYLAVLELVNTIRKLNDHKTGGQKKPVGKLITDIKNLFSNKETNAVDADRKSVRLLNQCIRSWSIEFVIRHGISKERMLNMLNLGMAPVDFKDISRLRDWDLNWHLTHP